MNLKYLINNFTVYLMSESLLKVLRGFDPPTTHMLLVWIGQWQLCLTFWNLFLALVKIGFKLLFEVSTLTSEGKCDLNQSNTKDEDNKVES